jgi:hypothetical protein
MAERKKRITYLYAAAGLLLAFAAADILTAHRENTGSFVTAVDAKTVSKSVVTIVTSMDKVLPLPEPLDAENVTYAQVDAAVRRALDLDTSETNLRKVIKPSDWVIVKINMVCAPIGDSLGARRNETFWRDGIEHWGDVTDARVVKSVVNYMVEKIKPKRITIVEGSGTWAARGKRGQGPQYERYSYDEDGWNVRWRGFDNICYREMCEEFTHSQTRTKVDYVDLNEDAYCFVPVPGGAFQRTEVKSRNGKRFGRDSFIPGTGKLREGYYMPETMLGPNKLVNIPAMKMNAGGGTLVFKNYVGAFSSVPYGDGMAKSQMDRYGFAHGMVDIFSYKPTNYAVIAGFWASEKDWPTHTLNLHHNIVIAGGNPVAVEATALRAMGVNPAEVVWTHLARAKGFGSWEEKDITVVGTPVRAVRRNFIKTFGLPGDRFSELPHERPVEGDRPRQGPPRRRGDCAPGGRGHHRREAMVGIQASPGVPPGVCESERDGERGPHEHHHLCVPAARLPLPSGGRIHLRVRRRRQGIPEREGDLPRRRPPRVHAPGDLGPGCSR